MRAAEVPEVEDISDAAAEELAHLTELAGEQNARRNSLFRARQAELVQRASVARRLAALEEDLQKNLDAQKLRNFGSKIAETFAAITVRRARSQSTIAYWLNRQALRSCQSKTTSSTSDRNAPYFSV